MSDHVVFDRPAYIGVIKVHNVFVAALFMVIETGTAFRIVFQLPNESGNFLPYRINNVDSPYFASVEEAQKALDEVALAKRWTAIRRLERW